MHPNSLKNLAKPFEPGNRANPGGKPTAARNALSTRFIKALAKDFDEFGEEAICEVREKDPAKYLSIVASLVPKDMNINLDTNLFAEFTDEQLIVLASIIDQAGSALATPQGAEEAAGESELSKIH